MKVLLINANRYRNPLPVLPLGLCAVASSLERAGHRVELLDLCFALTPARQIAAAVANFAPDLVGVGIRNIDNSSGNKVRFLLQETRTEVIEPLKSAFSGPIVLGGTAVGVAGAECLRFFDLNYAVMGDGERAMVEVARRIEQQVPLSGIAGLTIRQGSQVVESNRLDAIEKLDELPWARPQRYLNLRSYRAFGTPFMVQSKRGCPLGCTYCTYKNLEGSHYRLRSPASIADEISEFVRETGIRHVEFVDSTFNAPLDHAKKVLRELISRKLSLRLSTMGLNPRFIDAEFAQLMKEAGFVEICIGAEAASDVALRSLGKNFGVEQVREAARLTRPLGIPTSWFLLLGAPDETRETVRETLRTMATVAGPLDLVNIGIGIRVYAGAPIVASWKQQHGDAPDDNFLAPVAFVPSKVSLKQIKAEAAMATALNHNFFMWEEGGNVPFPVRFLFHLFTRNQPIWRLYLGIRFLEKLSGLFLLRALGLWLRGKSTRRFEKEKERRSGEAISLGQ